MSVGDYAAIGATVAAAYVVFGLTGFGAAMVAVPVLVQFIPLHQAVPLLLLLDLVATTLVGFRNWKNVATSEVLRLFPFMLLGVFVGASVLANFQSKWLLVGLGVFVMGMAVRSLLTINSRFECIRRVWAVPAGVVGGIFGAIFGTGGPVYTMYLSRRLVDVDQFRTTIASVIFVSALVRVVAFSVTGLLQQESLMVVAALALPFSLAGLAIGSQLRRRVSGAAVKRLLFVFLAAGGAGVIYRGLGS